MIEATLVQNLGWILVAATVCAFAGRFIRVPAIITYIIAGLLLGPVFMVVVVDEPLDLTAELGIALLLFLVGLELSIEKIRDVGKVAVAAGIGQVVFTAIGGYLVAWLLGFNVMEGVFLAIALTFSSTVVVVKLLDQKGDLNSLYGRIAVGIFLVQDIVVIFALTFLAGLGRNESMEASAIILGLLKAFGGMLVLLLFVLLVSRFVLARLLGWASRSPETILIWSICWCFLVVTGAELLHLSLEIGAFLAGISLAQLPYNDDLRRRVHPLMNFFVAVFFVTLGIQMEFGELSAHLTAGIILSLFVLIGNPLIFMIIITRMGYTEKTAFNTSVTVAQISEFSFIFVAMGVASGLIGSSILSVTAFVGVVTISVSAYMILYSDVLYRFCRNLGLLKLFKSGPDNPEVPGTHKEGHIIVVGMNPLGRLLAQRLHKRGHDVLALDTDPVKLADLPCSTMIGNIEYASMQEDVDLPHASLLVSALHIEDTNNLLAYRCKQLDIPCAIHAFDTSVMQDLVELEADFLLTPRVDGAIKQIEWLRTKGVLPA